MDPVILCCIAIIVVLFSLVSLKIYKLVRPTTQNEDAVQQPQQQQRQRAPLSNLVAILFISIFIFTDI